LKGNDEPGDLFLSGFTVLFAFSNSVFVDILLSITKFILNIMWEHAVAQLAEALRYKSEGRSFDSRWCHWSFPLT
jgi:hypothetical protein